MCLIALLISDCNSSNSYSDQDESGLTFDLVCANEVGIGSRVEYLNYLIRHPHESVECLIESIDTNHRNIVGHHNLTSSVIRRATYDNYLGIEYAFNIELIMQLDSSIAEIGYAIGYGWDGIILPLNEEGEVVDRSLTLFEMEEIQHMYEMWWRTHMHHSIEIIRETYKQGNRPLSNSKKFFWE